MLLRFHDEGDMTDQERVRWTKLVADFEAREPTQREFASERGVSFSNLLRASRREDRRAHPAVWPRRRAGCGSR